MCFSAQNAPKSILGRDSAQDPAQAAGGAYDAPPDPYRLGRGHCNLAQCWDCMSSVCLSVCLWRWWIRRSTQAIPSFVK